MERKLEFFSTFAASGGGGTTKYALLRKAVLTAIENGYWAPGEKLPAENQIAQATRLALGTVQRALRELAAEGVIRRVQGHGSFVAEPRKPMQGPWHCRFLDDAGTGFLPIFPQVLWLGRIAEQGPWSGFLEQAGDNVLRIDRRISINHEFSIYSVFYANADRFGSILHRPVPELESANFKMLLAQDCSLPITILSQDMRFLEFPDNVCKAIEVKRETTGLYLRAMVSAGRGVPLYFQEWYIPPNGRTLRLVENAPIGPGGARDFPFA